MIKYLFSLIFSSRGWLSAGVLLRDRYAVKSISPGRKGVQLRAGIGTSYIRFGSKAASPSRRRRTTYRRNILRVGLLRAALEDG